MFRKRAEHPPRSAASRPREVRRLILANRLSLRDVA